MSERRVEIRHVLILAFLFFFFLSFWNAPTDLLARLDGDVLRKDLLGLGGHLGLRLDLLVLLARQPEFQILLAELGAQESSERRQAI